MKNKWLLNGLIFILFILIFTAPIKSTNITNLPDPFQDYKINNNEQKNLKVETTVVEEVSKESPEQTVDKDKSELKIPFIWKGLISYNNNYIALLSTREGSKLLKTGETLQGYTLKQISLEELIFEKNDIKGSLTLGGEDN